jgi:hypothetical protein
MITRMLTEHQAPLQYGGNVSDQKAGLYLARPYVLKPCKYVYYVLICDWSLYL